MTRLATLLCATLYVALIIGSDAGSSDAGTGPADGALSDIPSSSKAGNSRAVLTTEDGRELVIAAVFRPARVDGAPGEVAYLATESINTPVAVAEAAALDGPALLRVTGSRVNLRDGPSTDHAILTSLPGGTEAELLHDADSGWFRIRAGGDGIEGYMSAAFLTPAS